MCGIAALFAYHSDAPEVQEQELTRIRDHMRVRGPDGEGSWFDLKRRVGLGHRRLSIIDLSQAGAQPMLYPERELTITFNGEIYNYKELRADLEKKGHLFHSQSDTEVLLHLYAEHGRDMLTKLSGMYAFVIWDNKKQELFLARDPFGIKPLYYSDNGKIALGGKRSYMKAVIKNARKLRNGNSGKETLTICAHINLLPAALLARRISGGFLYLIVYGIDAWKPTRNLLANACVRSVDGFISISNHTKRRFMRWSRLRDDQGMVLPCCVDLSAFSPGRKPEALMKRYNLHGKKVIMTLGRLASEERYKGFDEVIEVLPQLGQQIPNLAYLICGDGPDRARLVEKAKSLGLRVQQHDGKSREQKTENRNSKMDISAPQSFSISSEDFSFSDSQHLSVSAFPPLVIFAGKISEEEKADHYRLADLYVMPSTGEGFGIVFLEALASGLPVIGSKADASREALMGGRLGALVDPRDPEEILSTIVRILNQPEDQSRKTQNLDSVDYFSAARFEQRAHTIIDAISE